MPTASTYKTEQKWNKEIIIPENPLLIREERVKHSSFDGWRQEFRNKFGNQVKLLLKPDRSYYTHYEYGYAKVKQGAAYEIPNDHPLRENANFLFVNVQNKHDKGMGYNYLNEYKTFVLIGDMDMDQIHPSGHYLEEIAKWSVEKHGDLAIKLTKASHYAIRTQLNNAVIENSCDLEHGLISKDRIIPSALTLDFQGSTDHRTQIAPGVWCMERDEYVDHPAYRAMNERR